MKGYSEALHKIKIKDNKLSLDIEQLENQINNDSGKKKNVIDGYKSKLKDKKELMMYIRINNKIDY
jgi:hypothetical protein